jgi:ABC-type cobalamin/Fe3+-siderophores transport system ATPase subunit
LFCRHLALLNEGSLVRHGTPEEVITAETIRAVYGPDIVVCRNPVSDGPMVAPRGLPGHTSPGERP